MGEEGSAPLLVASKLPMASVGYIMIVGAQIIGHGWGYATVSMPRLHPPTAPLCCEDQFRLLDTEHIPDYPRLPPYKIESFL